LGYGDGGETPELVAKYDQLVRRHSEGVEDRTNAVTLALGALRASRNGLALFADGRFVNRNARWLELSSPGLRWTAAKHDGATEDGAEAESLEASVEALARELLAGGSAPQRSATLTREGGDVVEVRLERVRSHDRNVVIVTAEDVTERVRREREMARARETVMAHERMRLLGELASGVAHDLNNTLHALSLRIGHLLATPLDDRQRQNVDVLARICSDAAERVSRLQELGRRREDVPTESFDVANAVEEALAVARPEIDEHAHVDGIRFDVETHLAADLRAVGTASELRLVFVNLLLNARDAMPKGGRIRISSRIADGRAEVTVQDEGPGIAPEHLERVFDPFFTTKGAHGMGLGLAIVQGVMRRLGGAVAAANVDGGGAAFTMTFPIATALASAAAAFPAAAVAAGHRLLVVDDDLDNLEAMKYVLEDLGQDADLAASGQEALALVAEGRRYDLVLCDIGMPGMNGWQVAEELKRAAPGTRVMLVTGWAQEIAPDDPKRRGVDGVLAKPLDLAHLRQALTTWLPPPARGPDPGAPARPWSAPADVTGAR
jgi:signal transduction histidine kinase/ActR/RegA family two-component response regulator